MPWRTYLADGTVKQATAVPARADAEQTLSAVAVDENRTALIALAPGYRLYRVATNRPARVRLYATVAHRTADIARPVGQDPTGDHGVILDFVTVAGDLDWTLTPFVDGASMESPPSGAIPMTVTNLDSVSGDVTVELTYLAVEG